MRHIYTSIDLGSDTIKAVTCELYNGKLNLLSSSTIKSTGIRKGVIVDLSGHINGRGAYIKRDINVLEQAIKSKALEKHLEAKIDDSIYEELRVIINSK